ncbi:hypothetical protein C8R43DRAFT_490865 [Mycena crocata]|nr:hypothetical protein C8R43DRAFT_490865 [Mycena crocata]
MTGCGLDTELGSYHACLCGICVPCKSPTLLPGDPALSTRGSKAASGRLAHSPWLAGPGATRTRCTRRLNDTLGAGPPRHTRFSARVVRPREPSPRSIDTNDRPTGCPRPRTCARSPLSQPSLDPSAREEQPALTFESGVPGGDALPAKFGRHDAVRKPIRRAQTDQPIKPGHARDDAPPIHIEHNTESAFVMLPLDPVCAALVGREDMTTRFGGGAFSPARCSARERRLLADGG